MTSYLAVLAALALILPALGLGLLAVALAAVAALMVTLAALALGARRRLSWAPGYLQHGFEATKTENHGRGLS